MLEKCNLNRTDLKENGQDAKLKAFLLDNRTKFIFQPQGPPRKRFRPNGLVAVNPETVWDNSAMRIIWKPADVSQSQIEDYVDRCIDNGQLPTGSTLSKRNNRFTYHCDTFLLIGKMNDR